MSLQIALSQLESPCCLRADVFFTGSSKNGTGEHHQNYEQNCQEKIMILIIIVVGSL